MNGNLSVISDLQTAAAAEAHLNLQYRLDQRSVKFMGVKKLARHLCRYGDDAHEFLKCVTDRILFLGGDPSYAIEKISEQKTVTDVLKNELTLELAIVQPYEQAVQTAMQALDDTTRNLFEHLLKWHQQHVGWLEQQIRLIDGLGEAEYIAEKL